MNNHIKTSFIAAVASLFMLSAFASTAGAQNAPHPSQYRKYRVTAYKKGDNSITSVSNIANVAPEMTVFVPTAFTPNGDGVNDHFQVKGEGVKSFTITIYNRWGERVFTSNDISETWDGKFHGKEPGSSNVYTWQMSAFGIAGGASHQSGTLTVLK